MNKTKMKRRGFIKMTAMSETMAGISMPFNILKAGESPNNKVNIATIGVGIQGQIDTNRAMRFGKDVNMVAFCDCDKRFDDDKLADYTGRKGKSNIKSDKFYKRHSQIPRYQNFHKMFDKIGKDIDAVIIATPDHSHCSIATQCMKQGKHVYVEKPMAHNINELRIMADVAKEYKVATQMGNQGRSASSPQIWNWINSNAIGKVEKVNYFINFANTAQKLPATSPVPNGLDWDLWQAPAPNRDFSKFYTPWGWRLYGYYGTGVHGDFGCHIFDAAYWSLKLGAPESISAEGTKAKFPFTDPENFKLTFKFPARENLPPVTVILCVGREMFKQARPKDLEAERTVKGRTGQFIIGDKATIMASTYGNNARIIPEVKMKEIGLPPKLFKPNSSWTRDHMQGWINSCRTGIPAASNFEYAKGLTEMVLLGGISSRFLGQTLLWDAKNMKITNNEEANKLVSAPTPRKGWEY